ncbi:Uncharacterized conserved protein [Roseovarius nanhaiticus]|uniref:Uncharacterized conserved protein n=1 Tax=Roseovarius nanhaiticus TaxID=573024 RepID=A0A1N7H3R3_9RHOB|nr:extensin family protein [Roseovarius nanhaiticus]SEL14272.1 Uncharacterized conserved protein [Roseovarius nanhaiticus]SIS19456.1 Uncharacterized conserved protein [Roseovarius nanhaiticus]
MLVALVAAAGAALASAPETSLRPVARPDSVGAPPPAPAAPQSAARPIARESAPENSRQAPRTGGPQRDGQGNRPSPSRQSDPRDETLQTAEAPRRVEQPRGGLFSSLRPLLRPLGIGREAQKRKEARARGMVCNDPAIQGEEIGRVPGRISGCGIQDAVKVRSIDGVALSQHALMDCRTASAIKTWIGSGMKPAVGSYGGGVAQLRVVAHYACRTRNNQRGGEISEHGKGRAIDIAGFQLRDGRTITVLTDWNKGQKGQLLRQMHRSACGPFGTVLGPNSDRFHADHFHFDTARHRGGSYCR